MTNMKCGDRFSQNCCFDVLTTHQCSEFPDSVSCPVSVFLNSAVTVPQCQNQPDYDKVSKDINSFFAAANLKPWKATDSPSVAPSSAPSDSPSDAPNMIP